MTVNVPKVGRVLERAEKEGRFFLLEPEVYEVLRASGIAVPRYVFIPVGRSIGREELRRLGTREVVLKVVSPLIIHKSDAGGVAFVPATPAAVNRACAAMLRAVPRRVLEGRRLKPAAGTETPLSLRGIRDSIRGFLAVEKVEFEDVGFGSEILIGLRVSREFGPVLTMGSGGLDVEYMSERLREGRSAAIASAPLLDRASAHRIIEPLAFFGKVAAEFRGRRRLVDPETLVATLLRFRDLALAFSPFSRETPFVLEEAEVNPFVVRRGKLVPLDGVLRFSRAKADSAPRPIEDIGRLLEPKSIGIIGVSERMNLGRIILRNVLEGGFPPGDVFVVKPGIGEIDGCRCVPTVADLPQTVDLFVLTLAADQCPGVMRDLIDHGRARSVILIAGGMGEKEGGRSIEEGIQALVRSGRERGLVTPVVNGGNCLGVISRPGRYDTTFIPEHKFPRPKGGRSGLAFISQSGAFMITRMSKMPWIDPLYAISLGNQIDLTAADYLRYLKDRPEVRTFAVYMEGFKPGDGLAFVEAVTEITASGRSVLVYKAGRSPEGRAATSSHTASVAGDYGVFRALLEEAGALVASSLLEFESLMSGLVMLEGRHPAGRRVGLMSNAGFECVVLADNLSDSSGRSLELASFSERTRKRIAAALAPAGIDRLQDVRNPLDVTPVADDAAFTACARAIVEDPGVDVAVIANVPMTPAEQTLPAGEGHSEDLAGPESFATRMIEIFRSTDKPVVVTIDAGDLYTPLARHLEGAGIPVFRRADEAVRFLRAFVNGALRRRAA